VFFSIVLNIMIDLFSSFFLAVANTNGGEKTNFFGTRTMKKNIEQLLENECYLFIARNFVFPDDAAACI